MEDEVIDKRKEVSIEGKASNQGSKIPDMSTFKEKVKFKLELTSGSEL